MAGCRVVKASMDSSVKNLNDFGGQYKDAGDAFVKAFKAAIEEMEGDSKDALEEFFNTNVEGFVTTDLPGAVNGLASLLEANATNFDDTDAKIAASIRGN